MVQTCIRFTDASEVDFVHAYKSLSIILIILYEMTSRQQTTLYTI